VRPALKSVKKDPTVSDSIQDSEIIIETKRTDQPAPVTIKSLQSTNKIDKMEQIG
jgi:hypothetical protein